MNTRHVLKIAMTLLGLISALPLTASALFNNRMAVQGYLKDGSVGMSGTYAMQIILKKNATAIWTKSYPSITVTSGVFSQVLSGNDDSGTPVPMNANLFNHAANSDTFTVDVKVDVDANGLGTGTDATFSGIDLVPVPLAMTANMATSLSQNGATTGQTLIWNGSAWAPSTLSTSTIPASAVGSSQISAGSINSSHLGSDSVDLSTSTVTGVLPVANGGTGLSLVPASNTLLVGNGSGYSQLAAPAASKVLTSDASGNIVWGTASGGASTTTANTFTQSQTFPAGSAASPGVIVSTAGNGVYAPAANNVAISTSGSAKLTVGTGVTVNSGGLTVTSGGATLTAGNLTLGAGNISLPSGGSIGSAGNISLSSVAGGTTTIGDSTGAATTNIQSGSGGVNIAGGTNITGGLNMVSGDIVLPAAGTVSSAGALNVAAAAGTATTVGDNTGSSSTVIQAGSGGVTVKGGLEVGTGITGGTVINNMAICSGSISTWNTANSITTNGSTGTIACAGAAVGSAVFCSPSTSITGSVVWVSYITGAGTITVAARTTINSGRILTGTWTCLVAK